MKTTLFAADVSIADSDTATGYHEQYNRIRRCCGHVLRAIIDLPTELHVWIHVMCLFCCKTGVSCDCVAKRIPVAHRRTQAHVDAHRNTQSSTHGVLNITSIIFCAYQ